jgi:hypothetical protein
MTTITASKAAIKQRERERRNRAIERAEAMGYLPRKDRGSDTWSVQKWLRADEEYFVRDGVEKGARWHREYVSLLFRSLERFEEWLDSDDPLHERPAETIPPPAECAEFERGYAQASDSR